MSAFPLQVVGWPVRTQEELRELLRLSIQRRQSDLVEALEHAVAAGEVPADE